MIVQFRGVLVHDLLGICHGVHAMQLRSLRVSILLTCMQLLLFRMLILEKILDQSLTRSTLIHRKAGSKLLMRPYLYSIQHRYCEVLAVVADDVVRRPRLSHVMNHHFAWKQNKKLRLVRNIQDTSRVLTGLSECFVVKP
jgi:hypothetical protein